MLTFETFLTRMVGAIEAQGRCFASGAFVINVSEPAVLRYFTHVLKHGRRRPFGGRTHRAFARQYRQLTDQYDVPIRGTFCGAVKRVALIYLFSAGMSVYAYVKLETHPARSLGHVRDAVSTYVVRRQRHARDPHARRETAHRTAHQRELNARAWREHGDEGYERLRVGAEIYVPRAIAMHLIGN